MTIERSHARARPTLPRASDARPGVGTARDPSVDRDARGLFVAGNRASVGSGLTRVCRKGMGDRRAGGDAGTVARDARRVAGPVIAALPSDAAPVRVLVAMHARHVALHAYYTHLAELAGLETDEGLRYLAVADRQSQRAERVLVTAQDMARVCAAPVPGRLVDPSTLPWFQPAREPEPEPAPEDEEPAPEDEEPSTIDLTDDEEPTP